MRMSITPSILCEGLPAEFEVLLNYAHSLDFKTTTQQKPDYQYLRDLFCDLSSKLDDSHDTDNNPYPLFKEHCPKTQKTPALKTPKKRVTRCQESEQPMTRK